MKNLYKIKDELYIISDKEKSSYCIKECPMAGLTIDRCDCSIQGGCSNKVGTVILTTNDLFIKYGVRAIPDDFLEWFMNNSSCEEVEVRHLLKSIFDPKTNEKHPVVQHRHFDLTKMICEYKYEIIIPKEEPKQKETFKEVAERILLETVIDGNNSFDLIIKEDVIKAMIQITKWQQEQILDFLYSEITERRDYSASKMCEKVVEFIEQFKKK